MRCAHSQPRLRALAACGLATVLAWASASAPLPASADQTPSPVNLTTLAVRVHHEDAMVAFYTEAFGLRFRVVETSGLRSRFGKVGGLTLKFVPIRDAADFDGFPVHQPGFEVPDVWRVVAIAQRYGGRVQDPPVAVDGRLQASIRDPDGNTIEIYGVVPERAGSWPDEGNAGDGSAGEFGGR